MKNDPNPTRFTDAEKLELIEKGLMDPKEMGLSCKPSELPSVGNGGLKVLPPAPTSPKLGPWITFEASPVPLDIRAHWAAKDAVIVPFDKQAWAAEHANEQLIQVIMRCGTMQCRFEQLFEGTDPTAGFAELLKKGGELLTDFKSKMDAATPKTDEPNPSA